MEIIIDASNLVLGRLSSYAAKQAFLGNSVDVVNCEECIIRGNKDDILERYRHKMSRGTPIKGPFIYKRPDMFVKRTIRGMLPYKQGRGRILFKNVKCHIGFPEKLKSHKPAPLDSINVLKAKTGRRVSYVKLNYLCRALGWKPKMVK